MKTVTHIIKSQSFDSDGRLQKRWELYSRKSEKNK